MTLYDHLIIKLRRIFPEGFIAINVDYESPSTEPFTRRKIIYLHYTKDDKKVMYVCDNDEKLIVYIQQLAEERVLTFNFVNETGGFYD